MTGNNRFDAVSWEEHDEAERFLEDLLGESSDPRETQRRRSTRVRRAAPRVEPPRRGRERPRTDPTAVTTVTAAPTTPASGSSITAQNLTDAGVYATDPDPGVARQPVHGQRVQATRAWLVANPPRTRRAPRVASREAAGDPRMAQGYDRLVSGLVLGGFPVSMWGVLIATSEVTGSVRRATPTRRFGFSASALSDELLGTSPAGSVRNRLAAPGVGTWLQRAAEVAGVEWDPSTRSKLTQGLRALATAAGEPTAKGMAVAAGAMLALASSRLLTAFPDPGARTRAATAAARLDYPGRATVLLLLASGTAGIAAARAQIGGQNPTLPAPLGRRASSLASRVRALQQHFKTELPSPYTFISQW